MDFVSLLWKRNSLICLIRFCLADKISSIWIHVYFTGMCLVFLPAEDRTVSIAADHLQPVQPGSHSKSLFTPLTPGTSLDISGKSECYSPNIEVAIKNTQIFLNDFNEFYRPLQAILKLCVNQFFKMFAFILFLSSKICKHWIYMLMKIQCIETSIV